MDVAQMEASNPARTLADLRWRGAGLDRAIETLERRPEMLTEARRERLRMLIDEPKVAG